jgi:hypothetical protein
VSNKKKSLVVCDISIVTLVATCFNNIGGSACDRYRRMKLSSGLFVV